MKAELQKLLDELGINIDDNPGTVDVSVFCSNVSKKVLTDCEVCDIMKVESSNR